jgi:hypothetical protein
VKPEAMHLVRWYSFEWAGSWRRRNSNFSTCRPALTDTDTHC